MKYTVVQHQLLVLLLCQCCKHCCYHKHRKSINAVYQLSSLTDANTDAVIEISSAKQNYYFKVIYYNTIQIILCKHTTTYFFQQTEKLEYWKNADSKVKYWEASQLALLPVLKLTFDLWSLISDLPFGTKKNIEIYNVPISFHLHKKSNTSISHNKL